MAIEIPDWVKYELLERWRRGRAFVNRNPRAVWGITLASGFILFLILISFLSGPSRPEPKVSKKAFFYDLNTKKLFVGKAKEDGPIDAPSGPLANGGPAGVKAHIFTYANEPNENDLIIRYLEKPDPNYVQKTDELERMVSSKIEWGQGKLLRRIEDSEWVAANSSVGKSILREAAKRDEKGRIPRYYTPR